MAPRQGDVARDVPVAEVGAVLLVLKDAVLQRLLRRGRVWQAADDDGAVGAILLVVIDADARREAERIADVPRQLAIKGGAVVLEADIIVRAQPVELRRVGTIGRAEQPQAG